jgi:hypothetical protein
MEHQPWLLQVLPNTILKKYAYLSPFQLLKISKRLNEKSNPSLVYIFEGSLAWYVNLLLITIRTSDTKFVCNLFSSGKYDSLLADETLKSRFFRTILRITRISGRNYGKISFDTKLMADKINDKCGNNVLIFPVPSSFPTSEMKFIRNIHHRVLVNIRSFDTSKLLSYISKSCKQCTFIIPKGPIDSGQIKVEDFIQFPNIEFDSGNISVENYASYVDGFDYFIILYKPSIDASGKILDAITRGVGVCVPIEATEWISISERWGYTHSFSWGDEIAESQLFNHPIFENPTDLSEPNFTPNRALERLIDIYESEFPNNEPQKRFPLILWLPIATLVYCIFVIVNWQFIIKSKIKIMIARD